MNNIIKVALTVFCTFAVSCAFAQCRPGSPCYQGNNSGYNSYNSQYDQQPQQGYRGQAYQQQGQHPTGEPSHYYKGLPVYMEGNAQPPAGADMHPGQYQQNPSAMQGTQPVSGAPVPPPAGK